MLGYTVLDCSLANPAEGMPNVRFHSDNTPQLLTYRRGRAAVSPDGMKLAVTNLFDGVDIYAVSDQRRLNSVSVDITENVSAPVLFLDNDSIIFGGGSGLVYIAEGEPLVVTQTLKHTGKPLLLFAVLS